MAFENMTYEVILSQMMDRVTENYPNLDTREGSILFNALAPAALEMAILYTELDNAIAESFIDTASREYIFTHCEQMGMDTSVFEATSGTHLAVFNCEVAIGSRWNCDLYNYVVVEPYDNSNDDFAVISGEFGYKMLCETTGTAPNTVIGELTPIDDSPDGLSYKELVGCLIQGENETSDEDIRQAYYDYVNDTQIDGNVAQYEKWCRDFGGIGNYKIFPMWKLNDPDISVKVSILDSNNDLASDTLIADFQKYLDPLETSGMGDGQAPIGAFVEVTTATKKSISVEAKVTLQDGYDTLPDIDGTIKNYFKDISYKKKGDAYITTVAYMTLGAEILKTEGVAFINELKINGATADVQLGDEEIPILGATTWYKTNGTKW